MIPILTTLFLLASCPGDPMSACFDSVFGQIAGGYCWSSSTYPPDPTRALLGSFGRGYLNHAGKIYNTYVRAVRGGP